MVRIVNVAAFFLRAVYCHKEWRIPSSLMSTSVSAQNRESKLTKEKKLYLKEELLKENRKVYEDTFGNIESFERNFSCIPDDPEDVLEFQRSKAAKGKTIAQYIGEIKSLLEKNDYKGAIKVLEIDMVNDKKKLNPFIYKVLISYNAKLGNLKEAYRIFISFKRRQGLVNGAMYTSMFNACANCKNSFLAIEKANTLRECLNNDKNYTANISNYNAMLKAYGRHGDFHTCLKIMDEILEKKDKVRSETYLFLLQACITDKNSGLRHALMVWRKMLQNNIKPSIFSFNLMLRCIRDCSLGDNFLIPDLIKEIKEESKFFFRRKVKTVTIGNEKRREILKIPTCGMNLITPVENKFFESKEKTKKDYIELKEFNHLNFDEPVKSCELLTSDGSKAAKHENTLELCKNEDDGSCSIAGNSLNSDSSLDKGTGCDDVEEFNFSSDISKLPNLLTLKPTTASVIKFGLITEPHYRLMLVAGGMKGFLKTMAEFGVKPNIVTFTQILSAIPSTLEAEEELISVMKAYEIPFDTGFFNVLIKRRIFRHEDISVKDALSQMHAFNIKPDILTFGILAMSCITYESGINLLKLLRSHSFRANSEILDALLRKANQANDLNYVRAIVKVAKEDEVKLDSKVLALLSNILRREKLRRKMDQKPSENTSIDLNLTLKS